MSSSPPLLTFRDIYLTFGGKPLFTGLTFQVRAQDRLCLVGRNGAGKSTLLRLIAGEIEPDGGEMFIQPGIKIAYLPQDRPLPKERTIAEYIEDTTKAPFYEIEALLGFLEMDGQRLMDNLSGGERRRIHLAQALVQKAEVLLLDEPTNHLDIPAIEWLEEKLKDLRSALVFISHDRSFLTTLSSGILFLDRGIMRTHHKGYEDFERWNEALLQDEENHLSKMNARLRLEEEWMHRGVTARRKRNQGRLRQLLELREKRRAHLQNQHRKMSLEGVVVNDSSRAVIEAHNLTKSYGDKTLVKGFSTRIMAGDRVGVVGPNGAGKTTLVKLLLRQLTPDEGRSRLGPQVELIYFDQMRDQIDSSETLWRNLCPGGGDHVLVGGESRHVVAYLKDFMFTEPQIRGQASILSGGEKNRLALAKAFTQPGNLLVLDEPTNDLDMETLDLLQELLSDFPGTLLIISHDRDFLDKLTTSIIAVEGNGVVEEYVGGYTDYLNQRKTSKKPAVNVVKKTRQESSSAPQERPIKEKKVTYNDRRTYDLLPGQMDSLMKEINLIEEKLASPNFYQNHPQEFITFSERLEEAKKNLEELEEKWLVLAELLEGT